MYRWPSGSRGLPDEALGIAKTVCGCIAVYEDRQSTNAEVGRFGHAVMSVKSGIGIEFDRQQQVADWYTDNIGKSYVPLVRNGEEWKNKFTRLEAAIKREEKSYGQSAGTNRSPEQQSAYDRVLARIKEGDKR